MLGLTEEDEVRGERRNEALSTATTTRDGDANHVVE